jgi:hypothetical protein
MKHIKSLLLAGLFLTATGCATLNYLQAGDIKTAVRIATVLYVDNDPEKAADVLYVITETRKDIDKYEEISIAKVTDYVRENIVWTKLEPLEAIAAEAVIARIAAAINNEITHAQIPPDKIVLVHSVLDWIEEAILLSQLTLRPDNGPSVVVTNEQLKQVFDIHTSDELIDTNVPPVVVTTNSTTTTTNDSVELVASR